MKNLALILDLTEKDALKELLAWAEEPNTRQVALVRQDQLTEITLKLMGHFLALDDVTIGMGYFTWQGHFLILTPLLDGNPLEGVPKREVKGIMSVAIKDEQTLARLSRARDTVLRERDQ